MVSLGLVGAPFCNARSKTDDRPGATAVQIVPQLAKWAKHLTVFQRTASAVNVRGNRETNVATWKTEVASHPGWQKERNMNFFKFVGNTDPKPKVDMVSDGWTGMPSFSALIGSPAYDVGVQNVGDHVARMHALDFPHSEKVRRRAMQVVKDEKTAKDLQAWYPGWCKRPCVSVPALLGDFPIANVYQSSTTNTCKLSISRM